VEKNLEEEEEEAEAGYIFASLDSDARPEKPGRNMGEAGEAKQKQEKLVGF
jgi:hypothetical protein